jgi:hypothetical protein
MSCQVIEWHGARVLVIAATGAPLGSYRDATDLIGDALSQEIDMVIIPAARLDPIFFQLSSGVAGAFIQKVVQYRLKLAIVGDISAHLEKSQPLRDFVRESNRGRAVFFLPDVDAACAKISTVD